jgi:hypothetical protein
MPALARNGIGEYPGVPVKNPDADQHGLKKLLNNALDEWASFAAAFQAAPIETVSACCGFH